MTIIDTVKIIRGETDTASQMVLLKSIQETGAAECVFDCRKQAGVPVIRFTHGGGRGGQQKPELRVNSAANLWQLD